MKYKYYEFAFLGNRIYNHERMQRVRWWNRVFGFPGRYEIYKVTIVTNLGPQKAHQLAKEELEQLGYYEQIMGDKF